jgi:MATE family multidrug resistance protein
MSPGRANWALAWPLILANLSVPLLGLVDLAVIGRVGSTADLAAVGLGTSIVGALYFLLGFLRTGTAALAAQALGAGDTVEAKAVLVRGLLGAALAGTLLAAASPILLAAAGAVLRPDPAVAEGLGAYVTIRLLGAPAALLGFVGLGWCLGLQDARRPLALTLVANLVNAALTLALVAGLRTGVAGAAAATVLAEGAAAGLLAPVLRPHWRRLAGAPPDRARVLAPRPLLRLLAINRDLFLRSLFLETAFLVLAAASTRQGQVVLAANSVLKTFFTFSAYGLDGFAHATEALVGRAVGAGDAATVRAAVGAGLRNGAAVAVAASFGFWLLGDGLVRLVTDLEEVRAVALDHLALAAALPLVSVWAFLLDGVFFGAARAVELRNAMALSLVLFLALLGALQPALGNTGLWLAFLGFLLARGATLGAAYRRLGPAGLAAGAARP